MTDRFEKCNYCSHYDEEEGCMNLNYDTYYKDHCFRANKEKILEKAKEMDVSVTDLLALIKL